MATRSFNHFYRRLLGGARTLELLIKGVGPVVAVLWIGWQYHQSRADKRVEATLDYVKRFESGDTSIGKAQRALTDALWQHQDEIADLRTTKASAMQLKEIRGTIVRRVLESAQNISKDVVLVRPIDEIDDFFNELATCIQGSVCDQDTAIRYFRCSVAGYANLFESVIEKRETLAPNFGWGLRWISENSQQDSFCRQ